MGNMESRDVVLKAAGVDLRRSITNTMWSNTSKFIKVTPIPLKFLVSKESSEKPAGFHYNVSKAKRELESRHSNDNVMKKNEEKIRQLKLVTTI